MINQFDQNFDYIVKVIIIGNTSVGKTNLLYRFTQNLFTNTHLSTIGIKNLLGMDYKIKNLLIKGKKLRMTIWDTAGQQRFRTITQAFYKGASGIILVYSVTDKKSYQDISNWMNQISLHASQNVSKIILSNKCDCQQRAVTHYYRQLKTKQKNQNKFTIFLSSNQVLNRTSTLIWLFKQQVNS